MVLEEGSSRSSKRAGRFNSDKGDFLAEPGDLGPPEVLGRPSIVEDPPSGKLPVLTPSLTLFARVLAGPIVLLLCT